ncbi:MAG: tRNA lysidine(34) synthetase TilS [Kiritimatiellia bacterium]
MLQKLFRFIKHYRLVSPGSGVVVAVSGGADSVALLTALVKLAPRLGIGVTAAHLDHCIRGEASAEDARFVAELARVLDVPLIEEQRDVPRLARRKSLSLETAAREARYSFLAGAVPRAGAESAAVAHTADDQAETVLLRLARGAGATGLSGMARDTRISGVRIVRPMLEITREEVISFLQKEGRKWREDESNRNTYFLRNRVRHRVLPLLASELNPSITEALRKSAEILSEEDDFMNKTAAKVMTEMEGRGEIDRGEIQVETFSGLHRAVARRVIRLWLTRNGVPGEAADFETTERIIRLGANSKGTRRINLAGGFSVVRRYGKLALEKGVGRPVRLSFRKRVRKRGETVLHDAGIRVVSEVTPGLVRQKRGSPGALPARASIRYSAVKGKAVTIRSAEKGDRIRPTGMKGTKKLQDIFVDAKVASDRRARIPLLECSGEVIWLPGYSVARGWEVTRPEEPALQLRLDVCPQQT